MKKTLIIIGILVIAGVGWLAFQSGSESDNLNSNANCTSTNCQEADQESKLKPWAITVGLYDPAEEPGKLTKLLESRLKELGFKTVLLTELVDPEAANQEATTLLYRTNTQDALEVVIEKVISSSLFRRGLNEAITEDVIISVWGIDDINWGSFSDLAEKYNSPEPAEVSVLVLNAGAESGEAGKMAILLQEEGYTQAEAQDAEEETAAPPILIYYQRNYKNAAKKIRKILLDYDYSGGVSYRSRLEQEANIVIVLASLEEESVAEGGLELEITE